MKKQKTRVLLFALIVCMLPGTIVAQAVKDSIRKNYTRQDFENFVMKERRGEVPSTAGPVTSMRAGGDVLVNNNGGSIGTEMFTQSETSVIAFGNTVVIGFNDSGSLTGDANKFTGWSYSTDGGATFTDGGTLPTQDVGDAGDPVLARNETTGRIYFATLGFSSPYTIQVFRSDDDAVTWSAPVNGTPGGFNEDKQWIVVDNYAGSGNGNVYLISRRFGGTPGIYFFSSTDDGDTFGPDGGLQLVTAGVNNNRQGAFLVVGPSHEIYAFWMDEPLTTLNMRKSTDFGATFDPAVTIFTGLNGVRPNNDLSLTGLRQGTVDYASFRSNSFPHAAINPVSGQLYVIFNNNPDGDDKADVFLVTSEDGGATWGAPIQVNDDGTTTDQWQPTVSVTPNGLTLGVFYYSRENDAVDNNLITYNMRMASISGTTLTFDPSSVVSDVPSLPEFARDDPVKNLYMGDYNTVYATNTAFHVVWSDNRDDLPDGGDRKDPNVYYESIPIINNQPPVAQCQNVSAYADALCQAVVTASEVDDGSYDPDGDAITLSLDPAGPFALGTTDVVLTVDDGNGGIATCDATVTVFDNSAPVPPTPPANVSSQCASGVPVPITLTATDNCDGPITVSPTDYYTFGSCPNDFVLVRTWTFADAAGNSSSVSQTITVLDNIAPVPPAAPADLLLQCASEVPPEVSLTAYDNCDGAITVAPTSVITPGGSVNDFVEVRTWTFTDVCGNTSSVSQTITVFDDTPPELTLITDPIVLWPPDHKYKTISIDQVFVSVYDNCSDLTIDDVYIASVSSDEAENALGDGDGKQAVKCMCRMTKIFRC
ncbi:MAG: sialidase family protein [bacterium]